MALTIAEAAALGSDWAYGLMVEAGMMSDLNVTTLLHRRSTAEPAHVAMHATEHWLAMFREGQPASVPCLGCPSTVRHSDLEVKTDG